MSMSNRGKICTLWLLILMTIPVAGGVFPCHASAAAGKKKAFQAYNKFLSKKRIDWDDDEYEPQIMSKLNFAIAYIDKNEIPELVIYNARGKSHGVFGDGMVYTYRNGKLKKSGVLGCSLLGKVRYYEKIGIIKDYSFDNFSRNWCFYYKLSAGKVRSTGSETEYNYDDNRWEYTARYKKCSRKKYRKRVMVITKNKTGKKFKWFKNTAANRKKHLK